MNRIVPALALVAVAALVAPSGAASKGPAAGKNVHVGVIADVTGAAGVYGTPQKNAYELANEDIKSGKIDAGGANLTFDVQDAATDPQAALTSIESKHPDVIAIGALFPEGTKIIQQAGKLGIKTHMIGGNGLNSPEMYTVAGPSAQGTVVGAAWYSGAKYPSNVD